MNLIEEIKKNIVMANVGSDGDYNIEPMLYADVVNEVAFQYAIEMCKKQRQICAKEYKRREAEYFEIGYDIELSSTGFSHEILNAPLATEEK